MNGNNNLRNYLAALEDAPAGPHLSLEELRQLAVTEGSSPQREHLARCAECLTEFRDAQAFFTVPEAGEVVADKKDVALAWQVFKPNLADAVTPAPTVKPRRSWREIFAPRVGWALAVGLLLLAAANLWWALRLRGEKSELARTFEYEKQGYVKQLNDTKAEKVRLEQQTIVLQKEKEELQQQKAAPLPVEDEGRPPRGPNAVDAPIYQVEETGVELPPPARNFVLVLKGGSLPAAPNYPATLVNKAGKVIWRGGLKRDRAGKFTITLAQSLFQRGAYRLRIAAPDGNAIIYPIYVK